MSITGSKHQPFDDCFGDGNDRPRWDIVSLGMSFMKKLLRQWDRLVLIDDMLYLTMVDTDLNEDKYLPVVPNSKRTVLLHFFQAFGD